MLGNRRSSGGRSREPARMLSRFVTGLPEDGVGNPTDRVPSGGVDPHRGHGGASGVRGLAVLDLVTRGPQGGPPAQAPAPPLRLPQRPVGRRCRPRRGGPCVLGGGPLRRRPRPPPSDVGVLLDGLVELVEEPGSRGGAPRRGPRLTPLRLPRLQRRPSGGRRLRQSQHQLPTGQGPHRCSAGRSHEYQKE